MSFPVENIRALCKKRGTSLAALERSLHTPPFPFLRQIKSHTFSGVAFFCVQPVCNFSVCPSPASFYHVHRHVHAKCLLHAAATPHIALRDALGFLLW